MIETDAELLHRKADLGGTFGPLAVGGIAPGLFHLCQASLLLALTPDAVPGHGDETAHGLPHRPDLVPAVGLRQVHVDFTGRQLFHRIGQHAQRPDHGEGQRYGKEEGQQHAAEAKSQHGNEALHFNGGNMVGLGHDRLEGRILRRLQALDAFARQGKPLGSLKTVQIARDAALEDAGTHGFQLFAIALQFAHHLLAQVSGQKLDISVEQRRLRAEQAGKIHEALFVDASGRQEGIAERALLARQFLGVHQEVVGDHVPERALAADRQRKVARKIRELADQTRVELESIRRCGGEPVHRLASIRQLGEFRRDAIGARLERRIVLGSDRGKNARHGGDVRIALASGCGQGIRTLIALRTDEADRLAPFDLQGMHQAAQRRDLLRCFDQALGMAVIVIAGAHLHPGQHDHRHERNGHGRSKAPFHGYVFQTHFLVSRWEDGTLQASLVAKTSKRRSTINFS